MSVAVWLAAVAALAIAGTAHGQPQTSAARSTLCGIEAAGVADARARTAADPRFKRDGGDALHETFSADSIQAIWTFVTPKHPAYPAAVCRQVVQSGGAMQLDRQVRCEAGAAACAAFTAELDRNDDGSGDGE